MRLCGPRVHVRVVTTRARAWVHIGCIPRASGVGVHGMACVQGTAAPSGTCAGGLCRLLGHGGWTGICDPPQVGGLLAGLCLPISELRLWCYPLHLWVDHSEGN